ncbi:25812_t:CDS:2, partial [Gigaspora margarita]
HWESIKDITESTAPSIHDSITRSRVSYLNGGGGEWTPECMEEKKFPRVVIWDELNKRADYYEEVLTNYWAKCPRLQELKKKMRCQNNRVQSDLFREVLP